MLGHCTKARGTQHQPFRPLTLYSRTVRRVWTREADGRYTFGLAQGVVDLDGFDGLPGVEELYPLSAGSLVGTP